VVDVIGAGLFALVVLWIVGDRIRRWTQNVDKAMDQVVQELGKPRPDDAPSEVTVWSAHPLSDHMIKELAVIKGYRYLGEKRTYNGTRALTFQPPKKTKRKLSLDV
jgi:hypothetical protein